MVIQPTSTLSVLKSDFSFYPENSTSMKELKTLKVGGDIRFPRGPMYLVKNP